MLISNKMFCSVHCVKHSLNHRVVIEEDIRYKFKQIQTVRNEMKLIVNQNSLSEGFTNSTCLLNICFSHLMVSQQPAALQHCMKLCFNESLSILRVQLPGVPPRFAGRKCSSSLGTFIETAEGHKGQGLLEAEMEVLPLKQALGKHTPLLPDFPLDAHQPQSRLVCKGFAETVLKCFLQQRAFG